jgi:hypothetical protein
MGFSGVEWGGMKRERADRLFETKDEGEGNEEKKEKDEG